MAKPGGYVVTNSLFTDALVGVKIEVTQYNDESLAEKVGPVPYNIYCLDRFCAECHRAGASSVVSTDFEIDVDLPRPAHRHMGTYTEKLESGRRLQISGPLLMPWKFVLLRKGEAGGMVR
jgi:hypothetical protein